VISGLKSVKNSALAGFFVGAVLLLTGCVTPQMATLDVVWPADLVNQAELTRVPFYFQDAYECGPVSLAMVAGAVEVEVEAHVLPDALVEQVYLPGRQDLL
jgi:coenzyme F420-reducing hydrogenase gamma subunit